MTIANELHNYLSAKGLPVRAVMASEVVPGRYVVRALRADQTGFLIYAVDRKPDEGDEAFFVRAHDEMAAELAKKVVS